MVPVYHPSIEINNRRIGLDYPPYVIAEISANHNGNIENAMYLISEAKKAGASAVKLQTYTADTMTIDCDHEDFQIKGGLWGGQTLYNLYRKAFTPWEWHAPLFDHAKKMGITVFSTPFDETAVELLERLNTPAYKIASFEAIDLPLIRVVASTGKPIIISTGMANAEEISEAIEAARQSGCKDLAILHCVSGYPAPPEDYNLRTIPDMIDRFGIVTGLSDHTLSNVTAITAIGLGASILEKHFTISRNGGGPDDSFSLEPNDLASLCRDVTTAWGALGHADYTRAPSEEKNARFRRSLYFVRDVRAGELVTQENVRSIRPGFGLPPKFFPTILGKKIKQNISRGTAVKIEHLNES